ncbi:uncharacterized protein NECHADRAFT_102212 [Fusarium vanettenii 77-13-4]|uniref:G domain-containing protein n=1 Tax=Fusarium vanettenii (strain ATCC MYA-4622 / CBS 123669 / FGSC 9596 / NRRL 45880 / 77-13-4) TaxID=660122 RepID=C7ZDG7_FUSV7|nr:uncharacterized protein NECHADRAFT_102212 [Fusarium vanettenii 77-13-4]EEU37779.1 hypothetical protein NECHADRAFT_102212 [Fusarium vanettenii 77-13-4]
MADIPIPSTETESLPNGSPSTPRSSFSRLRTPSVSITPPPAARAQATPARSRNASSQDEVVRGMNTMRLSEPNGVDNLSDMADAVNRVARGSDSRATSLTPEPTTSRAETPRQRRRSRRSSSDVDRLPHSVLDEELPQDAFHSPEFQQAFRDAKQLMSTVEGVLGSSSLHNSPESTIRRLHNEAGELARFEYPSTRTVGFVGDSGVGKSSLLNSLLDVKGLARTSNSGEACTCVVTEFHYHNRDTLDIEVNLFTMEELREQLTGMLQSYRHYHLHSDEMEDAERREKEDSANLARDTFRAMFRGQLTDEAFLINRPEQDVLETLFQWAARGRPSAFVTKQSGLSQDACSKALMELASEPPSRNQPAQWPYIRSTKVFLNAHILSRGLILVDLPGLRDLNSARKMITERYLLTCNEIFAICNIGRAVTDEGVHQVFELARRARLSNVGIVCTRSDDILAEEAIRDWRGQRARAIKSLMDAIATDERDANEVEEDLSDYQGVLDDDLTEEEVKEQRELWSRQRNISARKQNHEFELKQYLVTTRNSFVTRELRVKYNERVATDEINIFCVSNKDYWDHRDEAKTKSARFLQLSGILQVRKHCISIVANSQRRIATRYIKDQIPALLAQVDLWVQSGARTASEERREALCRKLDDVERQLRRGLTSSTSVVNRVAHSFNQDFTTHVYGPRRISSWSQSAKDAARVWEGWHHSELTWSFFCFIANFLVSYAAFCRQYGDYCTPAVGPHNWNEEIMEGMVEDLEDPWQELCNSIQQRQTNLVERVDTLLDTASEQFETGLDDDYDTLAPLMESLFRRQQLLLDSIERINEQFETDLGLLRIDSLSGVRSSTIGRAMESSYRGCNQEYGTGSHQRRKNIIRGTISNQDFFTNLMRTFRDSFRVKAEESQSAIRDASVRYLDVVQETFDLVRSENVARESEQDPDFRLRVDNVARTGRETIQRVHRVIDV